MLLILIISSWHQEYLIIQISEQSFNNDEWDLDFRYGAKVDLGYDITDKFAAFVNVGAANNHYEARYASGSKT